VQARDTIGALAGMERMKDGRGYFPGYFFGCFKKTRFSRDKFRRYRKNSRYKRIIAPCVAQYTTISGCALMLVKFEIYSDGKYWCGRGIGVDIFTQGKTLDELMANIREAVGLHFEEELGKGESIRILSISETEVGTVARAAGC
jgi:hypothetical protein